MMFLLNTINDNNIISLFPKHFRTDSEIFGDRNLEVFVVIGQQPYNQINVSQFGFKRFLKFLRSFSEVSPKFCSLGIKF